MKTILYTLTILLTLLPIFNSQSQITTPDTTDFIRMIPNPPDGNKFEVTPLAPSRRGAFFSHLWWSGDNSFSFSPIAEHNHRAAGWNNGSSRVRMTDITTESYGTGGPPPLTYSFQSTTLGPSTHPKILSGDTLIYVQTYRNAVINDTMYLIVTYANPIGDSLFGGSLIMDVGTDAEIWWATIGRNLHFLPNGETYSSGDNTVYFDMGPNEERSILIPVKINVNEEDSLDMEVRFVHPFNSGSPAELGKTFYRVAPKVAHSHDPNIMIEHSDVNTHCDYRGGKIHYTVKFQNEGDRATEYVRVVCHFDDKVDLNSISGIKVPKFYNGQCTEDSLIMGRYCQSRKAIFHIDHSLRTLTIEMDHLILESLNDTNVPFLDMVRDQIEFDILVHDNYLFGPPVLSYSEIFFDRNSAIVTNIAKTGCSAPVPLSKGGGFQCDESFLCKYKWFIIGGFSLLFLLLIILLIRKKKKEKTK